MYSCRGRLRVGSRVFHVSPVLFEGLESRLLLSAPGANWKPAWSDEFNGNRLDAKKWNIGLGWTGDDGTNRHFSSDWLSYITNDDVVVGNGVLQLLTRKQDVADPSGRVFHYTEGMINSRGKFAFNHGYVEIRAQIPAGAGPGLWPSFWMLHDGWPPEDDVAEWQTSGNRFHQGLAYGSGPGQVHWDDINTYTPPAGGFHTYGMEWGPGYQVFTVDGQITHTTRGNYVPNVPMYLLLNSGVEAAHPPTAATVFPNSFEIDYVRVYKQSTPGVSNPGFEGGSLGVWTGTNGASVVATNAHSGSYALQTNGDGSSAEQTITGLKPKTSYVLTGWAQVGDAASQARIGVKDYGGADVSAAVSATGYTPVSVSFTTGRSNRMATIYGLQSAGSGSAWFDDFAIHQAAQVENGNFEAGASSGWTTSGAATVVRDHPHRGRYALREDGSPADAEQTIYGLATNTTYRLAGFAKVSGPEDVATIGIKDDGAAEVDGQISATRYRPLALTFTTGAGSTSATIFCDKLIGSGSAWFDDLRLIQPRVRSRV